MISWFFLSFFLSIASFSPSKVILEDPDRPAKLSSLSFCVKTSGKLQPDTPRAICPWRHQIALIPDGTFDGFSLFQRGDCGPSVLGVVPGSFGRLRGRDGATGLVMVSLEEDGVVGVPSEGAVFAGVRSVVDVVGAGGGGVEGGAGLELVVGVRDAGALQGLDERVGPAGRKVKDWKKYSVSFFALKYPELLSQSA